MLRALSVVMAMVLAFPTIARGEAKWEEIADEDGVKVWQREVPGTSFVEFRGRGVVRAPILDVAAVIRDADREEEWMHSCSDARTLAFKSSTDAVVYNRTESPFFMISDRDTVLMTTTEVSEPDRTILVKFWNIQNARMPPLDGVVRMPKCKGHWKMVQVSPTETEVEYQVQADPGGSLPAWLVNWASKDLPYHTLLGLRKQVRLKGYEQHKMILERYFDGTCFAASAGMVAGSGEQPSAESP